MCKDPREILRSIGSRSLERELVDRESKTCCLRKYFKVG